MTADLGLVLVRLGMDREHLYVAMTRGRHANHCYVTPDPTVDDEHDHGHGQPPTQGHSEVGAASGLTGPTPEQQALRILEAALATSGAQDATHTALQQARVQAGKDTRRSQQDQAYAAERERHQARELAEQELPEHRAARAQLQKVQTGRSRLGQDQTEQQWSLRLDQAELDRTVERRAIRHRRDLTERVAQLREAVSMTDLTVEYLDGQISDLTRQHCGHEQDRRDRIPAQRWMPPTPKPVDPHRLPRTLTKRPTGHQQRPPHPERRERPPVAVGCGLSSPRLWRPEPEPLTAPRRPRTRSGLARPRRSDYGTADGSHVSAPWEAPGCHRRPLQRTHQGCGRPEHQRRVIQSTSPTTIRFQGEQ